MQRPPRPPVHLFPPQFPQPSILRQLQGCFLHLQGCLQLQGCLLFPRQEHKYPISSLLTTQWSQSTTMAYSLNRSYPRPLSNPTFMTSLCADTQLVTIDNQPTASPNMPSPSDRYKSAKQTQSLTPTPDSPSINVNSPVAQTRKSGFKVSPMTLGALHKEWGCELKAPTPSFSSQNPKSHPGELSRMAVWSQQSDPTRKKSFEPVSPLAATDYPTRVRRPPKPPA